MNPERFYIKPEEVEHFTSLYQILDHAKNHYPDKTAYRQFLTRNQEISFTFSQIAHNTDALRAALLNRDFAEKHCAIFGETSAEWITAYLAVVSGMGTAVPLDRELPAETLITQLDFAEAELVFCSEKGLKKLRQVLPLCESIKTVVLMRSYEVPELENCFAEVLLMNELIAEGEELLKNSDGQTVPAIDPDKTCVIIYTSGTTGANKGVMLSNRSIMGTLRGCARLLHYPSTSFSVLPINHSYELHAHIMSCMYCGTTVCINDDLKHLVKNLERFAPEMSCMVPVMLDLLVKRLKKQIADSGREKQFYRTLRFSNALRKAGIDRRRKLFAPVLDALGGNLRMIICGGAALKQDTADFLIGIGIDIFNGYGITECSPVAAVNPLAKIKRNSVGHILPTMDVRIEQTDENGNGEIQLKGDNVMKGYYKAPEDTAAVFTQDGWFRTGDIGRIDKDNFLYISGRLKNLIILANGKNVFPEEIEEELMKRIPYIRECVVYSDEAGTGIYALCCPDEEFIREHASDSLAAVKEYMQNDMNGFNSAMPGYKRITDFEITEKEFEKSTTHKIQRYKIAAIKKGANENV